MSLSPLANSALRGAAIDHSHSLAHLILTRSLWSNDEGGSDCSLFRCQRYRYSACQTENQMAPWQAMTPVTKFTPNIRPRIKWRQAFNDSEYQTETYARRASTLYMRARGGGCSGSRLTCACVCVCVCVCACACVRLVACVLVVRTRTCMGDMVLTVLHCLSTL